MFVFGNPKEILKFYMFPKKNSEKTNKFLTKAQCDRRLRNFLHVLHICSELLFKKVIKEQL